MVFKMNYDKIYQIWEKETDEPGLIKIEKDFYKKFGELIKEFYEEIEKLDNNSLHRKLLEKEFKNLRTMIRTIYSIRFHKILNAIEDGIEVDTTLLTETELNLYKKIRKPIQKYLNNINLLLEGQSVQLLSQNITSKYIIVRILEGLPEIVGNDEMIYGPFQVGDIVSLPKKIAESMLEGGAATFLNVNLNNDNL